MRRAPRRRVRPLLRVRQIREFRHRCARQRGRARRDRGRGALVGQQPEHPALALHHHARPRHPARDPRGGPPADALARDGDARPSAIVMPVQEGKAVAFAFDEGRAAERILVAATLLGPGCGNRVDRQRGAAGCRRAPRVPEGWSLRTVDRARPSDGRGRRRKAAPGEARLPRDEIDPSASAGGTRTCDGGRPVGRPPSARREPSSPYVVLTSWATWRVTIRPSNDSESKVSGSLAA